jgi:ribonuclease HI
MNPFQLMMKASQPSGKHTKNGYYIVRGSKTIEEESCYLLQFDGLSQPNPGISTAGAVLFSPKTRNIIFEKGEYIEYATNNQAEYTGLILGLKIAIELGVKQLLIEGDSQLVISQTEGKWDVKSMSIIALNREATKLLTNFDFVAMRHIFREQNTHADRITNKVFKSKRSFFKLT